MRTATQRRDYKNFLRALVDRYGPGGEFWTDVYESNRAWPIRTWQIWNEANFFYFSTPVSAKNYTSLLKMSGSAIKSVDPNA
ncbi:MAG: hypothetical protein ACSLFD_05380, partial [Solirubrobacterales bacterium]